MKNNTKKKKNVKQKVMKKYKKFKFTLFSKNYIFLRFFRYTLISDYFLECLDIEEKNIVPEKKTLNRSTH